MELYKHVQLHSESKKLPRPVRSWRLGNGRTGERRMKEKKIKRRERKKGGKNYMFLMEILQATGEQRRNLS